MRDILLSDVDVSNVAVTCSYT